MANRTTLGNWLKWIERPLQTSITRERDYMVEQANKIRRMFYDLYQEFEMEVDVEECFQVQDFGHCGQCDSDTKGITLPGYMNNVEAAWVYGTPMSLYSKWREYKTGLKFSSDCMRAVYDMPGRYATERDPSPSRTLACIQLMPKNPKDEGKKVKVTYKSFDGTKSEYVELQRNGYTKLKYMATDIVEVVLPNDLLGVVVIAQKLEDDIRILSEYSPYELVPSYRRIKITGICGTEVVIIRASRQYTDVFSDDDIVETDNRMAVEHAARYLFYSESGTGNDLLTKAQYHLEMMKSSLQGMNSRDIGVNKEAEMTFGPPVKRSGLWSQLGSHRQTYIRGRRRRR